MHRNFLFDTTKKFSCPKLYAFFQGLLGKGETLFCLPTVNSRMLPLLVNDQEDRIKSGYLVWKASLKVYQKHVAEA